MKKIDYESRKYSCSINSSKIKSEIKITCIAYEQSIKYFTNILIQYYFYHITKTECIKN